MTLKELADLVTTKVHRNDSTARDEAKTYIRSRYSMIWDSRPWRDTQRLISVDLTVARTAILPATIDRVMACRWGDNTVLNYEQPVTVMAINPTLWEQVQTPATYSVITPSGVHTPPGGTYIQMASNNVNAHFNVTIHGTLQGVEATERLLVAGTTWTQSANQYDEIFSLSKDSASYRLTVLALGGVPTLLTLDETETHRVHQRLNFYSTPPEASYALVLGKSRCKQLVQDSDATEISGIDHGLVAMAEGDMLEGGRQYAKAQLKMQEAGMLISNAADMENNQSANMIRLIPWE